MAENNADLRAVRDRQEILELFSRYCYAADGRDPEGWADCFAPDAVAVSSFWGSARGHDQLLAHAIDAAKRPREAERHMWLNTSIDVNGDTAAFRAYLMITCMHEGKPVISVTGSYHGTVVRYKGRWLFQERHVIADQKERI
jgi:ketosteroid isomerase-like protein